jgi:hypothetical protein
MNATRILIAAALLAGGGAASAQSATDAQCLLLSNAFAQQAKEPQDQKAAEVAIYFYLGRIGNQETAAQLKTLLDAQTKTITQTNAGTLMDACMKNVQSRMQLVQSLSPKQPDAKQPAAPTQPETKQQPQGR